MEEWESTLFFFFPFFLFIRNDSRSGGWMARWMLVAWPGLYVACSDGFLG